MSRFQFVAEHQDTFEVKRLCELVEIERSSYYARKAGAPASEARAAADAQLAERIRAVHQDDNTVDAPRVTAELNDGARAGERVNHKRVARVMRGAGIVGYRAAQDRHDRAGASRCQGARPAQAGLHRRGPEPALGRGHHLSAHRRRLQLVLGDRDRLLLPSLGRLGDRGPHAHRARP